MSPKRENSLLAVQAQNGMWDALWEVAVDEAYSARDAPRRVGEIQGSRRSVVDVYFRYHPEMKEWAEGHIASGTCEAATHDLREILKLTRERRRAARPDTDEVTTETQLIRHDESDWMAPFKSGPAVWPKHRPADIEGVAEGNGARPKRLREVTLAAFQEWVSSFSEYPTKLEAGRWAKEQGYSSGSVREMHSAHNPRSPGTHRKGQN